MPKKPEMPKDLFDLLNSYYGEQKAAPLWASALKIYDSLVPQALNESKSRKSNMLTSIFPMIAIYRAIQENGTSKDEALSQMFEIMKIKTTNGPRKSYESMGKSPIIFSMIKFMFSMGLKADSWTVEWLKKDKENFHYDIKECVWATTCKNMGCPELCEIFCRNDEINFIDVSPYLHFHRTQNLGTGGTCCDFRFSKCNPKKK